MPSLERINRASTAEFTALLEGIYDHAPWVAERASATRPFHHLESLKAALVQVVRRASRDEQGALIRAHPELAGQAAGGQAPSAEASHEQRSAGPGDGRPEAYAGLRDLNAAYQARFGFPFIVAGPGPRGLGLGGQELIAIAERRLRQPADLEWAEALRQIHRIAEIRLDARFGRTPALGNQVWDWAEALAVDSEPEFAARGQLTATYLSPAHQACAGRLQQSMGEAGFDEVGLDAVGNLVAVYHGSDRSARRLLTGSHYDTVPNGGRYDGRLGILVPLACVRALKQAGQRLPFAIELVAFAEEEGQRFAATFLASSALVGDFDPAWLDQRDAAGTTLAEAMQDAGLPGTMAAIAALARDPARYHGFVEVHIEQGPVLNELDLPLGVVSSINGSRRWLGEVVGVASHAGTTPMNRRRDAATAVAELALFLERRAGAEPDLVGTIGRIEVPDGSVNVVPGRCRFSLDIRAPDDARRDACAADVLAELGSLCARRGLSFRLQPTLSAGAAPCDPAWQARWARAVASLGLSVHTLPSGAGHDAMKLHQLLPQAMLFVRGQNGGISHNPLESVSSHDADLAARAFLALLTDLADELRAGEAQP